MSNVLECCKINMGNIVPNHLWDANALPDLLLLPATHFLILSII